MTRFIAAMLFLIANSTQASAPVRVNLKWEYKEFPARVQVFEASGKARLWETKSVAAEQVPIGKPLDDSSFGLTAGAAKRFVLVVRNDSDAKLYFFAAPHTVHPVEHSLGFKFKCLCINHAYSVGPHETWYRVVEFRLDPHFVGSELAVTHTIIGIDEKRAAAFSQTTTVPND